MKTLIILLGLCSICVLHAQNLGISSTGSSPNTSAGLDVDFNNKGVLIPRVSLTSLTDAVTIPTPATSLLVYSKGGAVTDGYYYNSGTAASPIWSSFVTTASTSVGCFTNWQLFTADGTFNVPAGITKIKVCVYGGGAGGGGGGPTSGGSGGGAGGYAEGIYTVIPLAAYAVTVGTGGAGGAASTTGNNGNSSSLGALISATGGSAGASQGSGGSGGIGANGYLNTSLGNGGTGATDVVAGNGTGGGGTAANISPGGIGGGGGGGGFGGGNGGKGSGAGSNALANTGAGGGGGGGSNGVGGNGAAGKVIVFW